MLSLVKPRHFLPVHGEATHLRAHARLAEAVGVDSDNIFILDNGDSLVMSNGTVKRGDPVESGIVYVDGSSVGDIGANVLRDRQSMSSEGAASVAVVIDRKRGKLVEGPVITMRGIPGFDYDVYILEAREAVSKVVRESLDNHKVDANRIKKQERDARSNFVWKRAHRRPIIMPSGIEI